MTTIAQFNIYGQPLMLTGGGPNNSTRVLMMYIQENAFGSSTSVAGISSAMAILLGFVIMAVSIVQFMVIKKWKDRRDEDARKQTREKNCLYFTSDRLCDLDLSFDMGNFTSFKSEAEIQKVGFSLIPQDWTLANFWACYKAMILLLCSAGL